MNDDFDIMNMAGSGKPNAPAADAEICIFFEEITAFFLPLLFWYLFRGRIIHIFKENPQFSSLLKKYHVAGQVVYTDWNEIDFLLRHRVDGNVLDEIEHHQDRWIKPSKTIRDLCSSLGTEDAEIIFKKALAIQMKSIFQIRLAIDELQKNGKYETPVTFIPGRSFTKFGTPELFFPPRSIRIPLAVKAVHFIWCQIQKIRVISLLLIYPFWIMHLTGKPSMKQPEMKTFLAGIRIYNTDLAFIQKERSIDFLVNGETLHRTNTVFFIETPISKDYREKLALRNYSTVDVPDILGNLEWAVIKKIYPHCIRTWFFTFIYSFYEWPLFSYTSLESMHTHVLWSALLERYTIRHHIAYNDTSTVQITRNIMLRKRGITTWYYVHSCGTMNYFSPLSNPETPHIVHAYLYYDRFVTWNPKVQKYYAAHPHSIKKFEEFGCLWSDAVRRIESLCKIEQNKQNIIRQWTGPAKKEALQKNIAVFDSTFGKDATLTPKDMICFIDGVVKILDIFPQCSVFFKMKYSSQEMEILHPSIIEPGIHRAYQTLKSHPRCKILDETTSEAAEVIGISDIVISACFTSPTIEALAVGKKGIFFDASSEARNTYYDQFPYLVAHSENELLDFVDFWINRITETELKEYQKKYLEKVIDWFMDGKAVERFRKALITK